MDPPAGAVGSGYASAAGESWRYWIARRLAGALVTARRNPGSAVEPADFALERIRLEGVDPRTWTPLAPQWAAGA
jgi:hypothetical protein